MVVVAPSTLMVMVSVDAAFANAVRAAVGSVKDAVDVISVALILVFNAEFAVDFACSTSVESESMPEAAALSVSTANPILS